MSNREQHPFVGLFIGVLLYSSMFILTFAGTAFVLGTADFGEWGVAGRLTSLVAGSLFAFLATLPFEILEVRKDLTEAFVDLLETTNDRD